VSLNPADGVIAILVAYDRSEHARRALERAAGLATNGVTLAVVAVALPSATSQNPTLGSHAVDPIETEEVRKSLAEARALLAERGIQAKAIEGHGDPGDVIVQQARELGADLIVLGTRGLNLAERAVLGSVSTRVLHHAPCDVLVVRAG